MNNNSVYSNAGVNRDLQRHCIISQVTGLAVSFAGSAGVALSAGTQSALSGTVVLSASNGVAFGMTDSTVTASAAIRLSASSNTTLTQTGTIDINSFVVRGVGGVSVGYSAGEMVISGATGGGGGGGGGVALSAGTISTATGTVVFSNSNGVSFGMNTNSVVTASTALQVDLDGVASTLTGLAFDASNGITPGWTNGTITFSHNGLTSQSNQAVSAGNGSVAFQTVSFSNANGISFSTAAGPAIVASHNGLTSQSNQAFSAGAASSTFQTLSFQDSNGVSFSNNAGAIRVTHDLQATSATSAITSNALHSTAAAWTVSATNDVGTVRRVHFGTGNGISFGLSTGANSLHTITASHNGITSQTAQTLGLYAVSNTTGQSSSTTVDARTLSFHGAGVASVGYSGGSVVISVPSGGGAGDGYNFIAVTNSTANSTARVLLQDSNGISFGMSGSNSATVSITASISQATLANGNNVSFGATAGVITASATWPSMVKSYAGNTAGTTQTLSSGTLVLAGGNNITLSGSTGAGVQTISVVGPTQTAQTLGFYAVSNTTGQSSSSTFDARTLSFHGAGVASVGYSGGSVVISVPSGGGGGMAISAGSQSVSTGTMVFSDSNGLSFGMSGSSQITMSNDMRYTNEYWQNGPFALVTNIMNWTALSNRPIFFPLSVERPITWNCGNILVSRSTSGSDAFTVTWGLYRFANKTQLSNLTSSSGSYSNTNTASISGLRAIVLPALTGASTLNPGVYVVGMLCSGAATASMNYSLRGFSSWGGLGMFGPGADQQTTATSVLTSVGPSFLGQYSATTSALPETVGRSQITHWTAARPIYLMLSST